MYHSFSEDQLELVDKTTERYYRNLIDSYIYYKQKTISLNTPNRNRLPNYPGSILYSKDVCLGSMKRWLQNQNYLNIKVIEGERFQILNENEYLDNFIID